MDIIKHFSKLQYNSNGETHRKNCPNFMSTKDPALNGTAKDQKAIHAANTTKEKPELSNFEVSAPAKNPTIAEKMAKFYALEKLLERREKIAEAIDNLSDFYVSPAGDGCNVRLLDSKGKTFAVSHPIVIGEIVNLAKTKLVAELEAIDKDFNFNF